MEIYRITISEKAGANLTDEDLETICNELEHNFDQIEDTILDIIPKPLREKIEVGVG